MRSASDSLTGQRAFSVEETWKIDDVYLGYNLLPGSVHMSRLISHSDCILEMHGQMQHTKSTATEPIP